MFKGVKIFQQTIESVPGCFEGQQLKQIFVKWTLEESQAILKMKFKSMIIWTKTWEKLSWPPDKHLFMRLSILTFQFMKTGYKPWSSDKIK